MKYRPKKKLKEGKNEKQFELNKKKYGKDRKQLL